jgi:hypothetical protein
MADTTQSPFGATPVHVTNPAEIGSGGGTVTQGDPQSDAAKPWLVRLLGASSTFIERTIGQAFGTIGLAALIAKDGSGNAQPLTQGSGTMASAALVTLATDGPGVANLSAMAQYLPGLDLAGHLSTTMGSAVPALVCAARVAGVHALAVEPLGTPSTAPNEARVRVLKSTPVALTSGGAAFAAVTFAASTTVTLVGITHIANANVAVGQFVYNAADSPDFAERVTAIGGGGGSNVTLTIANAYGGTLGTGNQGAMVFGVPDAASTNGTNLQITAGANAGKVLGVTQPDCNVVPGMRVYITADGATKAVRVLTATTSGSDTVLTFAQAYRGAGSAGAAGSILSGYVLRPPQSSNAPAPVPYGPLAVNDVLVGYADAAYSGAVVSAARVSS